MAEEHVPVRTMVTRQLKRRKQLERDLEHVTTEMYKRNRELADTNQTLSLLRTIDEVVLQSQDSLKEVCEQITRSITEVTDYPTIALFTRTSFAENDLHMYGWSVKGQDMPDDMFGLRRTPEVNLDEEWLKSPEVASARLSVGHYTHAEIAKFFGCSSATAGMLKKAVPIRSVYVLKLIARQRIVGLMVAGFYNELEAISEQSMQLLDRLSEPIGIALDNRLLFEENRRIVLQLQRSNIKLKALDETKDDFISMASHQLRTPLTSIKGYLSMVLEGDAGEINETQRKMLGQAFTSSQRMVYLIADLLNVSRLKTGKFIIESASTDLSQMIDEEMAQLTEAAASRGLTLTFKKPATFPKLMLDETKTRQVIMNFIDNAIYYTPKDGHIKVELKDTGPTIEFRVVDDGMGVPKAEQHHLFTKFYRAGNARKARPDGTGLGLFMAKKVVTAQGGAIIFESKESKGSTFGFTFSKAKLQATNSDENTTVPTTVSHTTKP
ncbi:MAG TPA: HAMP domain-containing sensor histidine kinase [Candidatus Microsaccharimonas sp.]|nr:HAMP domain-containing sensor histidine kinase [Candidatus Microsaccharimonas sp.]